MKKTLDTLVQDIYDKLDELTAGTAITVGITYAYFIVDYTGPAVVDDAIFFGHNF